MNNQESNGQQKIEEIEAEFCDANPQAASSENKPFPQLMLTEMLTKGLVTVQQWFLALPTPGKVIVTVVGGFLGLSLLNTVLHLVTSLITLAVLALGAVFVYKTLNKSQNPAS